MIVGRSAHDLGCQRKTWSKNARGQVTPPAPRGVARSDRGGARLEGMVIAAHSRDIPEMSQAWLGPPDTDGAGFE